VLNLAEVEYLVASQETREAILMREIRVGIFGQIMDATIIYCDSQSFIKISENLIFHNQSKHIDIWYHHLHGCV